MTHLPNKRILILIFVLVVVLFIVILIKLFTGPKQEKIETKPSETPSTSTQVNRLNRIVPEYIKTVAGITTRDEVENLADLSSKKELPQGGTEYRFYSPEIGRENIIVVQNEKVSFERAITVDKDSVHPKLSLFKSIYGEANKVFGGSSYYGKFIQTLLYTNLGVGLIVNPFTDEVFEIHQFTPTSAEDYLSLWGDEIDSNQGVVEEIGQ